MKRSPTLFAVLLLLLCIPGAVPKIQVAALPPAGVDMDGTTISAPSAPAPHFAGIEIMLSGGGDALALNYFSDCCGAGNETCCSLYFFGIERGWWSY